jgi:hypothetical protein
MTGVLDFAPLRRPRRGEVGVGGVTPEGRAYRFRPPTGTFSTVVSVSPGFFSATGMS